MKRVLAMLMVLVLVVANVPPITAGAVTEEEVFVELREISVKTLPDKTEYWMGESLDTTGLTLTAIYSNGSTRDITAGFNVDYFDCYMPGVQSVYVEYEGQRTSFEVTVITPTGLSVKTLPDKTEYFRGEYIDTKGLTLTVSYSNGTTKDITDGFYIDWFDSYMTGVQTVNVSHEGMMTSFEVTVIIGGYCGENLYWELDDTTGVLTISGNGAMSDWNNPWNEWSHSITSVVIEEGVTNIGSNAFINCGNLTSVSIPASVTYIGSYAFSECWNLAEISLPESVTGIGEYAFTGCGSLKEIVVPEEVNYINNGTFNNCYSLDSVTLSTNVTGIGDSAFFGCRGLVGFAIPESVSSIGSSAFYGCTAMTELLLPAGLTCIGFDAFGSCISLATVYYQGYEEDKAQMMQSFHGNDNLFNATWHYREDLARTGITVETLPEKLVYWVNEELETIGLTITIHYSDSSYRTVAEGFTVSGFDSGTAGTQSITVTYQNLTTTFEVTVKAKVGSCGESVTWSLSEEGVLTISGTGDMYDYNTDERPENAPWYDFYYDITTVVIENGVTKLGKNAFRMLLNLTSVSIPDSVTHMSYGVFQHCNSLTEITIPDSVTSLGDYVFYCCRSLKDVALPSGITTLGVGLFYGCYALTEITIPNSVTVLDYGVFEYCTGLTDVVIPNGVVSLGDQIFNQCTNLVSVTLPASITSIGDRAFDNCDRFTTVNYGGTQKQKAEIAIGNGNEQLIRAAWNYEAQGEDGVLTGIVVKTLPQKVRYMLGEELDIAGLVVTAAYSDGSTADMTSGFTVFGFDYWLPGVQIITVEYDGFTAYFEVTVINGGTCGDNLTWVLDESGVLTISGNGAIYDYDNPWNQWNYSITSVIIENGVTGIGVYAFAWCEYMTQITLPASLTQISDSAFDCCYNLSAVYYQGTRDQKSDVFMGEMNEYLTGATWYCAAVAMHQQGALQTPYESLEEALSAATSGTVSLLRDTVAQTVAVKPGVTLDLNGHTLTSDLVVVMKGAVIRDGGENCTGGGLLKISQSALVYAPSERLQIIPVWNGRDGYIFTKVTIQQLTRATNDESTARYMFLPSFSNSEAAALLSDGGLDNGLKFKVCMTWNGGKSQLFYTYGDDLVSQVYDGTGRLAFDLTITGIAGITDIVLNAEVVTDTGAIAASTGIEA